jgi:hypothetical protein
MLWQSILNRRRGNLRLRAACESLELRAYLSAAAFGSPVALPVNDQVVGNQLPSAVSGAFTSSGLEDVAVVNREDNGIDVLINQGNGTFTLGSVLPDGGGQVTGLAAGNLGNGQIDLVASDVTTGSIYVYLGTGNGTFATPEVYRFATPESSPVAATDFVTLADLTGDGNLDILVADDVDSQVVSFLNDGTGQFTLAQSLSTIEPGSIVVGNFFGNTGTNYAITNSGEAFIISDTGTLTGIGAISFNTPSDQAYTGVGQLITDDFNNDGIADIAKLFIGADGKTYVDMLPGGNGTFGTGILTQVTSGATSLVSGDFSDSGNEDLLVGGPTSSELFSGNGTGAFVDSGVSLPVGGWQIADVDAFTTSGNLDVVLPGVNSTTGKPGAFLFENGGNSTAPTTVTLVGNQNPASPTQLLKFTATVESGGTAGTGTVELLDSGKVIGKTTLINGVAYFEARKLTDGKHKLTADYLGSSTLAAGKSRVLIETVGPGLGIGNLFASFPTKSAPASIIAGAKLTEKIDLANLGDGPSTGASQIKFYASPTSKYDASTAVLVGHVNQSFALKSGGKTTLSAALTFPASLTPGKYHLLVVVADGNGHTNTVATTTTTAVLAPVVDLTDKVLAVSSSVKPGKKAAVSLEVFNTGNVVAAGNLAIELQTSDSSDGSDPQAWTTLTQHISIKPNAHVVLRLASAVPAGLAAGQYFVVATVDPSNAFHEPSLADHTAVSATPITLS